MIKSVFSESFETESVSGYDDPIAQLVEQLPFKQWVPGSSPGGVTFLFESGLGLLCPGGGIGRRAGLRGQ